MKKLIFLMVAIFLQSQVLAKPYEYIEYKKINLKLDQRTVNEIWNKGQGDLVNDQFLKDLNAITGYKLTKGNVATLLVNGMMSYPVRYRLIDLAQDSIIISTLSIITLGSPKGEIKDSSTKIMQKKLLKALGRGVKVFIIVDGLTSFVSRSHKVIKKLRENGAHIIKYNPMRGQGKDHSILYPVSYVTGFIRSLITSIFKGDGIMNRWHNKTFIVDGKYASVGGLNWGDEYAFGNLNSRREYGYEKFKNSPIVKDLDLGKLKGEENTWYHLRQEGWRDTDVIVKGPIVNTMTESLLKDYLDLQENMKRRRRKFNKISEESLARADKIFKSEFQNNPDFFKDNLPQENGVKMVYLSQRPELDDKRDLFDNFKDIAKEKDLFILKKTPQATMTTYYINLIKKAKKQILWGSFTLVFEDEIKKALVEAAKRGVKIYFLTNSKDTTKYLGDKGLLTYFRNKKTYKKFLKLGIPKNSSKSNFRVFEWLHKHEYKGKIHINGAFHSKVLVVDGVVSIVGSYNISKASYDKHAENAIAIFSPRFGRKTQEMFEKDLKYTQEVVLKD